MTANRAVEEVPKHGQLFVLIYANARTGRTEKRGVGSQDNKFSVPTAEMPSTTTENAAVLQQS